MMPVRQKKVGKKKAAKGSYQNEINGIEIKKVESKKSTIKTFSALIEAYFADLEENQILERLETLQQE